ncbi:MAG TPA: zinc-binding dehydrogenase, partial [Candidatus Binatus sp.]|uniref:zinc-dependent alcohol dehydrogenase n=1 Tax=Candidatus Binatus sp. TaxID=2811406 RepID=UPI002B465B56
ADDALLKLEVCGICGSDYEQYEGGIAISSPVIPGHEPLGIIEKIGAIAAKRWGVAEGDRVAVEVLLPCGYCMQCLSGAYRLCTGKGRMSAYGYTPIDVKPALWGGYAQYMYLDPHTVLHKVSKSIPAELAVMFNPLGAGIRWAVQMPGTNIGDTVVILGPGQRGLASVIACKEAGAGKIIVTGLARDKRKLALASEFGATHTINVDEQDPVHAVREITGGKGADVIVDVAAYSTSTVGQAIDMVKRGGTVILAGVKTKPVKELASDKIIFKEIRVQGALGVDFRGYAPAIRIIESGRYPLEKMHTHTLPLEQAERAINMLAGNVPGEDAIHIALKP